MSINIPDYGPDVFFYPWIGDNYEDGICFRGRNIEFGNRNDPKNKEKGFYKLAVLGKEHYCSPKGNQKQTRDRNQDQHTYINLLSQLSNQSEFVQKQINYLLSLAQKTPICYMHLQAQADCAHLTVCHHKTNVVIEDFFRNPKAKYYTSLLNFSEALTYSSDTNLLQIWNQLLFCEFYQKGMPKETKNSHSEIDEKVALKAFVKIIKEHQPDIIITWGKEPQLPILNLRDQEMTLRHMQQNKKRKFVIPRLNISYVGDKTKGSKYTIPFTVLDYNNKPCLVLMPNHPGTSYDRKKINTIIRCAFKYYDELVRWNPESNENNLPDKPITCEFNSCVMCKSYPTCVDKVDFKWTNKDDFNKCV